MTNIHNMKLEQEIRDLKARLRVAEERPVAQVIRLWKDFTFEAAHRLTRVPHDHQCARLHGHSYRVRIHCAGPLDPDMGWVVDYADISAAVRPVIETLDHQFLNDILNVETTAENLALWIARAVQANLPSLFAAEVFETPTTSVFCQIRTP